MIKDLSKEFAALIAARAAVLDEYHSDPAKGLDRLKELSREFYRHVAEATADINPGLPEMIESGHFDDFIYHGSNMCYLRRNFNINGIPGYCAQCGQRDH